MHADTVTLTQGRAISLIYLNISRSDIHLRDLFYLWFYTFFRLDPGVDFNILEVGDLK